MNYLLYIHGIGEQQPGTYKYFGERIRKAVFHSLHYNRRYDDEGRLLSTYTPPNHHAGHGFYWDEAYWADVTQPDEQLLKEKVGRGGLLHSFYIGSFGDLVAYSKLPYPPDKYTEIQHRFGQRVYLASMYAQQHNDTNAQLSVIGHSLGSVIASDGLYDMIKSGAFPPNMKLKCFFTMGSPLALFGLRYGLANFNKPVRPQVWLNFYYPQDVAALPLKPLNSAYAEAVTEDICLSPNGVKHRLMAMVPGLGISSHSWYFTDERVINRIAEQLLSVSQSPPVPHLATMETTSD